MSNAARVFALPVRLEPDLLAAFRAFVLSRFGISFAEDRLDLLSDRVAACCEAVGVSPPQLLARVQADDREVTRRLAENVSTNHTFFFREPESFERLKDEILPALPTGEVRLWSAAASSGDEAYSLAICLREAVGDVAAARFRILGTDLSERQVRIADQGSYPLAHLTQIDHERLLRWFRPGGLGIYRVAPELRAMRMFRRMNLTQLPWPFAQRFHVILLRNVLYYFEPPLREKILEACFDAAEPGAWLLTSVTEPMLDTKSRWTPVGPAFFRKGPA